MPAHPAVQAADAIHRAASANRQIRHIEGFRGVVRVLPAQGQQVMARDTELLLGVSAQILPARAGRETVESGRDRRVRSEEIPRAGDGERDFERLPVRLHEAAGAFQHGKGRMPFVQMTDFRLDAERLEQPPAADSQQHFLLQPQLGAATV